MKPIQLLAAVAALGSVLHVNADVPTTITYQGRVQVSGANFNGTGQFKFALVDPGSNATRQATAVATVTSGFITGIAVIDGGAGYSSPPTVTITDAAGSGATAIANVSGGAVTGFTVQLTGSGYSANPVVTIAPPPPNVVHVTHWSNDGSSAAGREPAAAVSLPVAQGLFTALLGDAALANMTPIPPDVLTNRDVRLRIWFNDGANGFAALSPDQPLTSAPYALHALNASAITGPVPASLLAGTIAPANLADGGIDASKLAADSVTTDKIADGSIVADDLNLDLLGMTFWSLGGNTGTAPGTHFLGTTDNQPLEFKVDDQIALRLLPTTNGYPNLIGGVSNAVGADVRGATVGGGFLHTLGNGINAPTISGGFLNSIQSQANAATIGGGAYNTNENGNSSATIAGGSYNLIRSFANYSTIGGGFNNQVGRASDSSTVAGGEINRISSNSTHAVISGGFVNRIDASASYASVAGGGRNWVLSNASLAFIAGGWSNTVGGRSAFAAGHRAKANQQGAFVWADSQDADFASTTSNQFNVRASGGVRFETGGAGASVDGQPVIAGQVNAEQLADGAVTAAKLAANSVTSTAIATGAVDTSRLADGAVTADKIFTTSPAFVSLTTLTNPLPPFSGGFGSAVAAVGSGLLIVGAYDGGGASAGVAYLFSTEGGLVTTFSNPTPEGGDDFGFSVAALGNDRVLIGAYRDNTGTNSAGAVYLFSTNGLLLTTFTNPTPTFSGDQFGYSVAAVGNDRVLIGTIGNDMGALNAGSAYLFSTNGTLVTTFSNPTPEQDDHFGSAVAALGSDRVLIGAYQDNAGATDAGTVSLFSASGTLLMTFTNPSPAAGDFFGFSLAGVGTDRVLIGAHLDDTGANGAGAAYLFSTNGTLLMTITNPAPATGDRFGSSAAAVGSDRMLIGAYGENTLGNAVGAAYLFSTNGTLLTTFDNPVPRNFSYFGSSVAGVSSDRVLIGSATGDAYLFSASGVAPGLYAAGVAPGAISAINLADGAVLGELLDDDGEGSGLDADLLDGLDSSAFWKLSGNSGTSPGTHFLGTTDNQPLEIKVNGLRAGRVEFAGDSSEDVGTAPDGAPNVILGAPINFVAAGAVGATIAGGGATNHNGLAFTNSIGSSFGVIGGGRANGIGPNSVGSTIAGGFGNNIGLNSGNSSIGGGVVNNIATNSFGSTIAGGVGIAIGSNSAYSAIGGGYYNTIAANSRYSLIAAGGQNNIGTNSSYGSIGGGSENSILANSAYATIPGGNNNAATNYAFAAGRRAKANHTGTFVWADSTDADFVSAGTNQFLVRASGGVHLSTNTSLFFGNQIRQMLNLWSTEYAIGVQSQTLYCRSFADFSWFRLGVHNDARNNPGGGTEQMRLDSAGNLRTLTGTIAALSDRNAKTNFSEVNATEILEKVSALPVRTWAYKTHDPSQRHIGPTAQDFHAAFGVGLDEKSICTVDADGVALAAIQGLNKKLEQELQARDAEIGELKRAVSEMKLLIQGLALQRREGQ